MYILAAIFTCFLAQMIGLAGAQDQPEIAEAILPEIRRSGETGSLNCSINVPRKSTFTVLWKRGVTTISRDDKIYLEEKFNKFVDGGYRKFDVMKIEATDRVKYILVVRRLQMTDSGNYTCEVQIPGESNFPSKTGELVVLVPPSIQQGSTTQTATVEENKDVNLTCAATGYPTPNITWMRPNGHTMPKPFHDKITVKGKTLEFKQLSKTDRGVYRCIADNAVRPPATFDTNLYVSFAPHAQAVQRSYGQAQNRLFDALLECRISGFPEPELSWFQVVKEETEDSKQSLRPITDDDKHVIHVLLNHGQTLSVSEFWYQLTIINVQANDYGEYICQGTNNLGTHQAKVKLYETTECQGPFCYLRFDNDRSASTLVVPSVMFLLSTAFLAYF